MKDWFEWNDIKCTEFGMYVLDQPTIISPKERANHVSVPGRSGSLTVLEGASVYDDITLSVECLIRSPYIHAFGLSESRISQICGWLKGSGKVVFANRPEGFYKARIENQISFDKILRGNPHMRFSVQFHCEPFFYLESGEKATTIVNDGSSSGVNLFDPTSANNVDGSYLNEYGAVMTGSTASGLSHYIDVTAGTTYYIVTGTTETTRRFCAFYDGSGNVLGTHNAQADPFATAPTGAVKMRFTYRISTKATLVRVEEADASGVEREFDNPGTLPARPLLKINGTGSSIGSISIGGKELRISGFAGINYIYVDTEAKIAYTGEPGSASNPLTLLTGRVSGDWIEIPTGKSTMTIAGSITSVDLIPRWRNIA